MAPNKAETDPTTSNAVAEVAKTITPEVKTVVTQLILEGEPDGISEELFNKRGEILLLVQKLLTSAGVDVVFALTESDDSDKIQVQITNIHNEISPELLTLCLEQLNVDFKRRGIVVVDDEKSFDEYKSELKCDRSAGTTWEAIEERLLANNKALLEKAAMMQGKGELIGVYTNGELCIKDRGTEPVIIAFDPYGNRLTIVADSPPNKSSVIRYVADGGRFGNYWEIRQAVLEAGYFLPKDQPDYEKNGIIAASEAVTGKPFVRGDRDGLDYRTVASILEFGDVPSETMIRLIRFDRANFALIDNCIPNKSSSTRGAMRFLRG